MGVDIFRPTGHNLTPSGRLGAKAGNHCCKNQTIFSLSYAPLFEASRIKQKGGYVMKKLMIILCAFSLFAVFGCASSPDCPTYVANPNCKIVAFKPGAEPTGYNGIKWETKLSTLERMKFQRKDASYGGIDFYTREGDTLKLENGKEKMVYYGFWKEKFYVAAVTTNGREEFNALKETVFKKFGEGAKPFLNSEEYLWFGKNADMVLRYNENSGLGAYYIRSLSVGQQIERS